MDDKLKRFKELVWAGRKRVLSVDEITELGETITALPGLEATRLWSAAGKIWSKQDLQLGEANIRLLHKVAREVTIPFLLNPSNVDVVGEEFPGKNATNPIWLYLMEAPDGDAT